VETWIIATSLIFLYLLATIVLGVVANRRMSGGMEDFLLYGRKAGFVVLYLTVVATFHSAFGKAFGYITPANMLLIPALVKS
jgi:Na+/proline symporter